MRIAFVTNEFVTEKHFYGGLANYLYRVAKALAEEGHEVHVVTGSETDKKDFQFNGIFIHRITLWSIPPCLKPRDMQGPTAERLLFNIKVWRKLRAINKKTKIDIIQYTNVYACGLIPGLLLRIPYVVRVSSYRPLWDNLNKKKWAVEYKMHAWIERLQLKLSRHTYVPSKTMKKILEETGLKNIKIIRSPAYIETGAWDFSYCDEMLKDKEYVLFFGRFQKRKGFHVVAQAAPSFLRQHPGAYMVCIGLNEDYKTTLMKENAVSLCGDNAARMIFMHQLQHAQLYPIIQRAKLVVLPSLIENLSNACLEAMMLAKPVIGTEGTSFEELIKDGENGFLVPAGDAESLARKMNEAWISAKLPQIGQAAYQTTKDFLPGETIKELTGFFDEIITKESKKQKTRQGR